MKREDLSLYEIGGNISKCGFTLFSIYVYNYFFLLSEIIYFSRGEVSRWRDIHERPHPAEPDSRVGHQSCAEINLLMKRSSRSCVDPAGSDSHSPTPPGGRKCRHFCLSSVLMPETRTIEIHFQFSSFPTELQSSHWNICRAERAALVLDDNSMIPTVTGSTVVEIKVSQSVAALEPQYCVF